MNGERDRPALNVTEEMLAVGAEVLREFCLGGDLAHLAEDVFRAMSHAALPCACDQIAEIGKPNLRHSDRAGVSQGAA